MSFPAIKSFPNTCSLLGSFFIDKGIHFPPVSSLKKTFSHQTYSSLGMHIFNVDQKKLNSVTLNDGLWPKTFECIFIFLRSFAILIKFQLRGYNSSHSLRAIWMERFIDYIRIYTIHEEHYELQYNMRIFPVNFTLATRNVQVFN